MATYAIGDVQGCFDELQALLQQINFDAEQDQLWFVGDLVNRGPKSLETLRFIKNLPHKKVVLGNHDLHLLALASGYFHKHHNLQDILTAPDCDELLNWLRQQPLFYYDKTLNYAMVHAGLPPQWDFQQAEKCAAEVEAVLRGNQYEDFLMQMYGDEPCKWRDDLHGIERLRFIVNALTRIRFCDEQGRLDLQNKKGTDFPQEGYMPWFKIPGRCSRDQKIIFGHWAALRGNADAPNVFALDTGCVWGHCLTAMRLGDGMKFSVPCKSEFVFKEDVG